MQGRGLRSVLPAHEQADDTADGVLLDSYRRKDKGWSSNMAAIGQMETFYDAIIFWRFAQPASAGPLP